MLWTERANCVERSCCELSGTVQLRGPNVRSGALTGGSVALGTDPTDSPVTLYCVQSQQAVSVSSYLTGDHSRLNLFSENIEFKSLPEINRHVNLGIELWGCASKSSVAIIQRSQ